MSESPVALPVHSPWRIGLRAARVNLVPGLILQGATLALLLSYYASPVLREHFLIIEIWKARMGFGLSALSGMLFGGLLPWLFRMCLPSLRPARPMPELLFGLVWWGTVNLITDAFYRGQGLVWGEGHGIWVVVAKVATDMLLYTPLWSSPANALAHRWKALGYPLGSPREWIRPGWYRRIVLPNLVPNWVVWIPGVTIVYCLPSLLQLVVANLIGCFWALMCIGIAAEEKG